MGASLDDVAALARVSPATVSRALRGLPNVAPATRARVLEAARQLEYVADPHASRLAQGRSRTIGVVVPRIGRWYYSTILDAIDAAVGSSLHDILQFVLRSPDARERFLAELPFRKRVDGLIVVDVPMSEDQLRRMADANVPIVTIGLRTNVFSSLTVDNRAGARLATEHLIGLGHRRIGLIGARGAEPFDFPIPGLRREGWEAAMRAAGLPVDPTLVTRGDFTAPGGVDAMATMLEADERPTAVFVLSDEMAVGAMRVLGDVGLRVPEDISIVGFDDHEFAEHLGLTTVRQDVMAQGRAAAEWVLEAVDGEPREHHELQRTRLVVRRTTAPPP